MTTCSSSSSPRSRSSLTPPPRRSWGAMLAFSTLLAALAAPGLARADGPGTSWVPRLYVDGQLGAFGDVRLSHDDNDVSDGLEPSGGGVIGIDVPLLPVFSLGVEAGATVWNSQGARDWEIGPSVLAHLSFMPRLRIPFGDGDAGGGHGAIYLAGQIGPSVGFVSNDVARAISVVGGSIDTGIGLHGGGLLGVQLFFTRNVGVDLGAGYLHHVVWHRVGGPLGSSTEVRLDLGQVMFRAGFAYAF